MKKNLFMGFAVGAALFLFSSCGPSELTVSSRPEPPYYARPISPGPGYVWLDGDWYARNGRYYYRQGRWTRPGTRVYVSGTWVPRGGGYYWRRGYWR